MTPTAVVLYGPPASGKDTITAALTQLDPRYTQFLRLKVGTDNNGRYRHATADDLIQLRASGQVLYENDRYGNTYVVDEAHLTELLAADLIPVIHIGQVAGIEAATRYPARWISVLLWCSRETTAQRAEARGSTDVDQRLTAWDETAVDLESASDTTFTGRIDTDETAPEAAASYIRALVHAAMTHKPAYFPVQSGDHSPTRPGTRLHRLD